jgi:hypothetical protein
MSKVQITEAEFIAYEDTRYSILARRIEASGVSLYEIAKVCNLNWETVKKAACAVPVKYSSRCRIELYLKRLREAENG